MVVRLEYLQKQVTIPAAYVNYRVETLEVEGVGDGWSLGLRQPGKGGIEEPTLRA